MAWTGAPQFGSRAVQSARALVAAPRARSFPVALPVPRVTEGRVLFVLAAAAYLAVASFLVFGLGSVHGDAWSRVGNASYVFFSRDPHLAAIGFVWNPLPSVAVMPLLPFRPIWPELVTHGFAANVVSAIAMAGCVVLVLALLRALQVPRPLRIAMTATLALHPLIVYYGANGMSEALFLLFLLWATVALVHWIRSPTATMHLISCGVALGLSYLTRYEAVGAAGLVIASVGMISFLHARGALGLRMSIASADAIIVTFPFAAAFLGWALASWVIVGSPFETFTSLYGNASQVALGAEGIQQVTGQGTPAADDYVAAQVLGIALALPIVGALAALTGLLGRRLEFVGPVAVLGGVLVFAAVAFLTGRSFGWLRFSISAVPLATALAGAAVLVVVRWTARRRSGVRLLAQGAIGALAVVLLAAQAATSLGAMVSPTLGREEIQAMTALLGAPERPTLDSHDMRASGSAAAAFLDDLDLGSGEVLVDAAQGFPIILQSADPRQFVITPDRDFDATLEDPAIYGVRYLLVPRSGSLDALSQRYPGIYATGAGFGPLVAEFTSGSHGWRIYEISEVIAES